VEKKYCRARQAAVKNMTHAHCMLHNSGYKHTPRICNTYCFFPLQQWLTSLHCYVIRTLLVCYEILLEFHRRKESQFYGNWSTLPGSLMEAVLSSFFLFAPGTVWVEAHTWRVLWLNKWSEIYDRRLTEGETDLIPCQNNSSLLPAKSF